MLPIIYEDDEIVVINKPSGLAVQGGVGILRSVDKVLASELSAKVYPVHRLDKDTSGVLIVARSSAAADKWTRRIAAGGVTKEYLAICVGVPPVEQGVLDTPVGGKPARTGYAVLEIFPSTPPLSLLRLALETGRTHQIRIQTAAALFPVVADDKYGDFKVNRILAKTLGLKKLCLHSNKTTVIGEVPPLVFQAPLPPHLANFLQKIPRTS